MLDVVGVNSVDELINETIPKNIRNNEKLKLPEALDEFSYIRSIKEIASKNKVYKSFIGQGYYNCIIPAVVQRNILENPGWYTAYTPYQPEISQGTLQVIFEFQSMICALTGMEVANASLYDGATATVEAVLMAK